MSSRQLRILYPFLAVWTAIGLLQLPPTQIWAADEAPRSGQVDAVEPQPNLLHKTAPPSQNQILLNRAADRGSTAVLAKAEEPHKLDTVRNITAQEARFIFKYNSSVLFLDVREPYEYDRGHIPGATNMPWTSGYLTQHHDELPTSSIVVYCQSGGRSAQASQFLVGEGYTRIYNMLGGYPAWVALGTRAKRWHLYR